LETSGTDPFATNEERLDGENGLLLPPNADHLFDRGFIGFEDTVTLSFLLWDIDRLRSKHRKLQRMFDEAYSMRP
jgi:predicted restriction endonuclease